MDTYGGPVNEQHSENSRPRPKEGEATLPHFLQACRSTARKKGGEIKRITVIGRFEWYTLWGAVNFGGLVSFDELRESLSGYKSVDSRNMTAQTYRKVRKQHKALIRAANTLQRKGLVIIKKTPKSPYAMSPRAEALLLRPKGLETARELILGNIAIITENTPREIHVYDSTGNREGTYFTPEAS